jgi:hypothetical protein
MSALFFTCPNTKQRAPTTIQTDVRSLRKLWFKKLTVTCSSCGEMHEIAVRLTASSRTPPKRSAGLKPANYSALDAERAGPGRSARPAARAGRLGASPVVAASRAAAGRSPGSRTTGSRTPASRTPARAASADERLPTADGKPGRDGRVFF